MKDRLNRLLLNAGAAEGNGGTPPKAEAPTYKVGDKTMNQSEFDSYIAGLEAKRTEAERDKLRAEQEKESLKKNVKGVFGDNADTRIEDGKRLFKELGHSDEEIAQWEQAERAKVAAAAKGRKGAKGASEDDEDEGDDNEMALEVQSLKETQRKMLSEQLTDWAEQNQAQTLASHKGVATLLEAAVRLQGKEKADVIRKTLGEQMREKAVQEVARRVQANREQPSRKLFAEAFTKAADELAKTYSTVIGDASLLGRSTETAARMRDPFAGRKPTPEPKSATVDRGTLDDQVERWLADELTLMQAESPEGQTAGSKA